MNSKQRKTLEGIFSEPTSGTIKWADIESLLLACGAEMKEGRGSRVRFYLNGVRAVFHRPHPAPTANKNTVEDIREFLMRAGVNPGKE
jgi:hypothetical protein